MQNEEPLSVASRRKDFGLNPHEERLIALIAAGYTRKESAQRLGISEQALRQHLGNIYDKLKVSNDFELILFALHHQLTDQDHMSPPGQ